MSGLSAILAQKTTKRDDRRIVAYASPSLSEVERKYSQTEREHLRLSGPWNLGKSTYVVESLIFLTINTLNNARRKMKLNINA